MERFDEILEKSPFEKRVNGSQEEIAKNLIFGILESETKYLNSPEISETLNKAVGNKDASSDLKKIIKTFSEKLAGQEISVVPGNNAEDLLDNTSTSLFGILQSAQKRGIQGKYEKAIREDFYSNGEYLHLLMNHIEFEKAELGGKFGFLEKLMTKEEFDEVMSKKSNYVKRCKEILEGGEERAIDH